MGTHHVVAAQAASASRCAAQAFVDDPLMHWLAGDGVEATDIERSSAGFFAPAVELGMTRGHTYGVPGSDGFDAVAIWSPPDVAIMREDEQATFGTAFHAAYGDDALMRLMALGELSDELHPRDPHFYLFIVGASTPGTGAGQLVLAPVLDRCDEQGIGAYLESSTPRNHGFYQRLGFAPTWQERPAGDGPTLTGMWREPQQG